MDRDALASALSAAVDEAAFDLERAEIAGDGKTGQSSSHRMPATQFREAYLRERDRPAKLSARVSVPQ